MNEWLQSQVHHVCDLRNRVIGRWSGIEMAIRENEPTGLPDWYDDAVPYLQLSSIKLTFADGAVTSIDTYQDDCEWGIYRRESESPPFAIPDAPGSIFRTREFSELPAGRIDDVRVKLDDDVIAAIELTINKHVVQMLAGEVYEDHGNQLRIVFLDESILVQVDGRHPGHNVPNKAVNPSGGSGGF